jgi:hypothetical protein
MENMELNSLYAWQINGPTNVYPYDKDYEAGSRILNEEVQKGWEYFTHGAHGVAAAAGTGFQKYFEYQFQSDLLLHFQWAHALFRKGAYPSYEAAEKALEDLKPIPLGTSFSSAAKFGGGVGFALGGIVAGFKNYSAYSEGKISGAHAVVDTMAEGAIGGVAGALGAYAVSSQIGGAIGSFIPIPVLGTLAGITIGAGIGILVGWGLEALKEMAYA